MASHLTIGGKEKAESPTKQVLGGYSCHSHQSITSEGLGMLFFLYLSKTFPNRASCESSIESLENLHLILETNTGKRM